MKFLNKIKKHNKIFLVIVLLLAFLAVVDVYFGKPLWDSGDAYRTLYWTLSYAIIIFSAFVYYLQTKDKSETISFIAGFVIMLQFGLADIFYYYVQFQPVEKVLWWLNVHPVMLYVANFMGYENVTIVSLYTSAIIGTILGYYVIKILKEKF